MASSQVTTDGTPSVEGKRGATLLLPLSKRLLPRVWPRRYRLQIVMAFEQELTYEQIKALIDSCGFQHLVDSAGGAAVIRVKLSDPPVVERRKQQTGPGEAWQEQVARCLARAYIPRFDGGKLLKFCEVVRTERNEHVGYIAAWWCHGSQKAKPKGWLRKLARLGRGEDPRYYGSEFKDLRKRIQANAGCAACVKCKREFPLDLQVIETRIQKNRNEIVETAKLGGKETIIVPHWGYGAICKSCQSIVCGLCAQAQFGNPLLDIARCPSCGSVVCGIDHITD
jgi:hypothetical protein